MALRLATLEDEELVVDFAMKFAKASAYAPYVEQIAVEVAVHDLLTKPKTEGIIILADNIGMIAGERTKFVYGFIPLAVEVAWWVEPEYRGTLIGKELKEAFEYWAKETNTIGIVMSCLDDKVAQLYEKSGYTLVERAYFKETEWQQ